MCGFSRTEQLCISQIFQWQSWEDVLPGTSLHSVVTMASGHVSQITPCVFSFWGYMKTRVYQNQPQPLEALIEALPAELAAMARKVMVNFRGRLRRSINNRDRHLSDIILKTHLCKSALSVQHRNKNNTYVSDSTLFFLVSEIGHFLLAHPVYIPLAFLDLVWTYNSLVLYSFHSEYYFYFMLVKTQPLHLIGECTTGRKVICLVFLCTRIIFEILNS